MVYYLLSLIRRFFRLDAAVLFERARMGEFAKFISYHIFCNENRYMFAAIVNGHRVADKIRCDSRTP